MVFLFLSISLISIILMVNFFLFFTALFHLGSLQLFSASEFREFLPLMAMASRSPVHRAKQHFPFCLGHNKYTVYIVLIFLYKFYLKFKIFCLFFYSKQNYAFIITNQTSSPQLFKRHFDLYLLSIFRHKMIL